MNKTSLVKIKGWNTVEDVQNKLGITKSTAYLYLHKLSKSGHVIQKIKKPRGTMYLVSAVPIKYKHYGMYEDTNMVAPAQEFSKEKIAWEQKIAFFLKKYKEEHNTRYYNEAEKMVRKIKDWKLLYRFLKLYGVRREFIDVYLNSRRNIKKVPRMPKLYKRLLNEV